MFPTLTYVTGGYKSMAWLYFDGMDICSLQTYIRCRSDLGIPIFYEGLSSTLFCFRRSIERINLVNYCCTSETGYHHVAQCAQEFLVLWNVKNMNVEKKQCTINIHVLNHTRNVIIRRAHTMRSTLRLLTVIDLFMFKTRGSYLWCTDQLHNLLVVNQNQLMCTSSSEISRAILTEPIPHG